MAPGLSAIKTASKLGGAFSRKPGGSVHAWLNVGNAFVPEIFEHRLPEARRLESAAKYRNRLAAWLKNRPETLIRASLDEVSEVVCKPGTNSREHGD